MKKIFLILSLCNIVNWIYCQDVQYSQYYASPLDLAPSFAGSTNAGRVVANYRMQWPFIKSYHAATVAADYNLAIYNSGVGLVLGSDLSGTSHLNHNRIGLQYAYNIGINKQWGFRPGVEFSYNRVSLDMSNLTFGDQLVYNTATTQEANVLPSKSYLDAAASVLFYSAKYWGGATMKHLLFPNVSMMANTGESTLPLRTTIFAGGKVDLNGRLGRDNEESIFYSVLYSMQQDFDQFDVGGYWYKAPLVVGLWYRGLPGFKTAPDNAINQDAVILVAGYKRKNLSLLYSYDITVSRLFVNTAGSHEVSLGWLFNQEHQMKKREKRILVPCPRF